MMIKNKVQGAAMTNVGCIQLYISVLRAILLEWRYIL